MLTSGSGAGVAHSPHLHRVLVASRRRAPIGSGGFGTWASSSSRSASAAASSPRPPELLLHRRSSSSCSGVGLPFELLPRRSSSTRGSSAASARRPRAARRTARRLHCGRAPPGTRGIVPRSSEVDHRFEPRSTSITSATPSSSADRADPARDLLDALVGVLDRDPVARPTRPARRRSHRRRTRPSAPAWSRCGRRGSRAPSPWSRPRRRTPGSTAATSRSRGRPPNCARAWRRLRRARRDRRCRRASSAPGRATLRDRRPAGSPGAGTRVVAAPPSPGRRTARRRRTRSGRSPSASTASIASRASGSGDRLVQDPRHRRRRPRPDSRRVAREPAGSSARRADWTIRPVTTITWIPAVVRAPRAAIVRGRRTQSSQTSVWSRSVATTSTSCGKVGRKLQAQPIGLPPDASDDVGGHIAFGLSGSCP